MARSKGNQYTPYIHVFAPLLAFITWVSGPWRYSVGHSTMYYIVSPIILVAVFTILYVLVLAVGCIAYDRRKRRYAATLLSRSGGKKFS